ncbi:hypothetical protein GR11A_00217 [Vibrio phage vB_VcorM_GR11A]|nr:hypothetical protein GR11A_00217 [Vibrio phage vB_VcorM_GR11A]
MKLISIIIGVALVLFVVGYLFYLTLKLLGVDGPADYKQVYRGGEDGNNN